MIIKLLGQPIIAIHEAEIAGTVDGVIIKGNRVNCIYHGNAESHFIIPIERAIIGSDAVMIPDVTVMVMASKNISPLRSMIDVYNLKGKHLGCVQGIEADEKFVVSYIYTEKYKIELSKIVSYERVLMVDMEEESDCTDANPEDKEAEAAEAADECPAESAEDEISMDIGPEISWEDEGLKPEDKSEESTEFSLVKPVCHEEDKKDVPNIDAKYVYLCGKQLLEEIEIEGTLYNKGTIIDADLIKRAIVNNAIVKVIVNAED